MRMEVLSVGLRAGTQLGYEDPLDDNRADDEVVVTTRRGLIRVALVAAETAARFEREGEMTDPMAWMLAPRALFAGVPAIEACLGRTDCLRGVLLHGLSLGMDALPEEIDELLDGSVEDCSAVDGSDGCGLDGDGTVDPVAARPADPAYVLDGRGCGPRLWTSFLVEDSETEVVHGFEALLADSRAEAVERLRMRCGDLAAAFELFEGFDPGLPMAQALVSPALADTLRQVEEDPASPLAAGLSVSVRQSFAA